MMISLPLAAFGNLMGMDGLVILIVLLLLFGAKKLPELARGLGQSLNEFRKARDDFEHELRAGQNETPRPAADRQPYGATPPAQTLPYNSPGAAPISAADQSPEALQKQVEQLQSQLKQMQEKAGSSQQG